jgi:DNA-binding transcriptional LysR family regulator
MDFFSLQCFVAVASSGSFTKASAQLGRTQSAVSQQIAKLELQLNRILLQRGRQLRATDDGELLLGYARQILALHNEVTDRFKEPELEGEVHFGLPEDFASVFLSEVLTDFTRIHPRIVLSIECDLTLNLYSRFKRREFDLVLVKMNQPDDFPNGIEVWSEKLEWVGTSQKIDRTKPLALVLSPKPCVYRSQALKALELSDWRWRIALSSQSFASTVAAVRAGMGCTVLPRTMIPAGLEIVKHKDLPSLADVHVSLLKRKRDNAVANSLAEFISQRLRLPSSLNSLNE